MNREIEFRAWLKNQKLMRYNVSIHAGQIFTGYCWIPFDNNVELMQYTGLKDKNGVKIFEGDIVQINDDWDTYGKNAGEKYEVYFNAGGFRLKPKYDVHKRGDRGFWLEDGNDVAVLGNIYENPELLEDE